MDGRPYQVALEEALRELGADDRDVFIVLARSGAVTGTPMRLHDIGQECEKRYGYSVTKQRVSKLLRWYEERVGSERWKEFCESAPSLEIGSTPSLDTDERYARRQKRRIGQMRSQARNLPWELQYAKLLNHFGVDIPERRSRTAMLMDSLFSMQALYEDFKVLAACGWRICYDCKLPKIEATNYYRYSDGRIIPWCKECNKMRAKDYAEKKRRAKK